MELEEMFKGRDIDITAAQAQLQTLAREEGLEFTSRTRTFNSRPAQELAKWAEQKMGGEGIHDLFYRAYFVDGINLADNSELVKIVESIRLDGKKAQAVLENREFKEAVDQDWQRCRELKIVAVPTYLCNDDKMVGAQTYENLERLITPGSNNFIRNRLQTS
jgi:predicted DsbA family dithiol-disulfide isomerase